MKIFRYLAFSALLAMSVSSANTQDYDKGVAAIIAGDFETAWSELLPLAESGNADTQYNIGMMYLKGEGVIQNYVEAGKWLRLAADQGIVDAQYIIGLMYHEGKGVIQNDVEAVKWYRLAADQGYAKAQYILGMAYRGGFGVIQNNVIAHMWLNIASANGFENAAQTRDSIAAEMTQEDISEAQAMAQECLSSGYKNCGD